MCTHVYGEKLLGIRVGYVCSGKSISRRRCNHCPSFLFGDLNGRACNHCRFLRAIFRRAQSTRACNNYSSVVSSFFDAVDRRACHATVDEF